MLSILDNLADLHQLWYAAIARYVAQMSGEIETMPRCFEVEQLDQDLGVMRLVKPVRTGETLSSVIEAQHGALSARRVTQEIISAALSGYRDCKPWNDSCIP